MLIHEREGSDIQFDVIWHGRRQGALRGRMASGDEAGRRFRGNQGLFGCAAGVETIPTAIRSNYYVAFWLPSESRPGDDQL
jgi:hypothetical protein